MPVSATWCIDAEVRFRIESIDEAKAIRAFSKLLIRGVVQKARMGRSPAGPHTATALRFSLSSLAPAARCSPRDKLVGLLWPETDTTSARGLLSVSVHTIRKALGHHVLVSEGEALRLDSRKLLVDTLEFENAFWAGDFEQAVTWYADPFLDGFSIPHSVEFDQWMDGRRERLERVYQTILERLTDAADGNGVRCAARSGGGGIGTIAPLRVAPADRYGPRTVAGQLQFGWTSGGIAVVCLIVIAWFVVDTPGRREDDPLRARRVGREVVVIIPFRVIASPANVYLADALAELIHLRSFKHTSAVVVLIVEVSEHLASSGLGTASDWNRKQAVIAHYSATRVVEGQVIQYGDSLEIFISWSTTLPRFTGHRIRVPIATAATEIEGIAEGFLAGILRTDAERREQLLRLLSSADRPAHQHQTQ